jgi:murein L,D-transpeptidase YcbB/YkuD
MRSAVTPHARGQLEVELSRLFLQFAQDIQSGILEPSRAVGEIKREAPRRNRIAQLAALSTGNPAALFRSLPPQSAEYARLMKHKRRLEMTLAAGGWGPTVPAKSLKPGETGNSVIALRNRMVAMGYLGHTAEAGYGSQLQKAVQAFQNDNGLVADGVAGAVTMAEINRSVEDRLASVIVAMERERWLNLPDGLGARHINVNLADFSAKIIDDGKLTFETRSVIGADHGDRRSPEFSDVMEYMVINPSWYVPRSIVTKEYLPKLQKNPNSVSHLLVTDSRGRPVNRNAVNFAAYNARNFPFSMRQPPSTTNALGLVKFMFPNKYNIYLHDTPSKSLFSRESRAFSHGCIRLQKPFEFAYALLAKQSSNPRALFDGRLNSGKESRLMLDEPVPVHLIYRTALTTAKGKLEFRRDVYGRDAAIWRALRNAGVALHAVQG